MAETKTTSIANSIYGAWISPVFQDEARHYKNPQQFLSGWNPELGTSTVKVPRYNNAEGAPNDTGVDVDTEYDVDEANAIIPTEITDDYAQFTIREYGMAHELSYTALEDTIDGSLLTGFVPTNLASTLQTAFNDDITADFADFTNDSGSPGSALTHLHIDDALYDLAERGVMGNLVGVLGHQQMRHFYADLTATGAEAAQFAAAADRLMDVSSDAQQGRNESGLTLKYKGVPFYRSGLVDTANTGADEVGAIWADGANVRTSAMGRGARREFAMEFDRLPLKRTVIVVGTMRQGNGILLNANGQAVISKATA